MHMVSWAVPYDQAYEEENIHVWFTNGSVMYAFTTWVNGYKTTAPLCDDCNDLKASSKEKSCQWTELQVM